MTTWWGPLALAGICALFMCGCSTTNTAGEKDKNSTASVQIHGISVGAVRGAAIDVFEGHGYKVGRMDRETVVFEKVASKWDNAAYGNWTEAQLYSRVQVTAQAMDQSTVRLSCQAYLVRDKGGATEEQIKPYRKGSYEKLLEEVAGRLNPKPAP